MSKLYVTEFHTLETKPGRHLGKVEWDEVETALGYLCTYGGISMSDQSRSHEGWPAPYDLRAALKAEWERAKAKVALQKQAWEE